MTQNYFQDLADRVRGGDVAAEVEMRQALTPNMARIARRALRPATRNTLSITQPVRDEAASLASNGRWPSADRRDPLNEQLAESLAEDVLDWLQSATVPNVCSMETVRN